MAKVLVVFYSRGGNTKKMAEAVAEGARRAGAECDVKPVSECKVETLPNYDAIVLGSPTYYGHPAAELKSFIDESVKFHGKLAGKAGGAFASCGVLGGGAETTIRALLDALLIHGMVIQGTASGGHYGPVSVGAPNEVALQECRELGGRVALLATKLA